MPGRTKIRDTFFKDVPARHVVDALLEGLADEEVWVRREASSCAEVIWSTGWPGTAQRPSTHYGVVRAIEGGTLLTIRSRRDEP